MKSGGLWRHEKIHSGEKPFKCQTCEKCFVYASMLRDHIPIHTGVKPYQCVTCPKSYSRRILLMRHAKTHLQKS